MLELLDNGALAKLFGYLSIACWIVVFTPQFYENYKRKNTDGVSMQFLTFWIVGDILNLIGVMLENLLFTMLLLALYYLFADCLLMGQVFYYRTSTHSDQDIVVAQHYGTPNEHRTTTKNLSLTSSSASSVSSVSSSSSSTFSQLSGLSHYANEEHSPLLLSKKKKAFGKATVSDRTRFIVRIFVLSSVVLWVGLLGGSALFFFTPGQKNKIDLSQLHLVPQLLGWGSALLYCLSRIPQIMQNFRNESVEGLSLTMFVFSVVGNITYCVSIILESADPTYLLINYPWLLGSGGTLFFDFTIFFQFYMYRRRQA